MIKLTDEQVKILKGMVEFAEASGNQILHIMENHGLDKIQGCTFTMTVDPANYFATINIHVGECIGTDFGNARLVRGKRNDKYTLTGKNTPEYELLFADEAVRERMEKILHREKPLPPDGLWIGDPRNDNPVGNWEWDINDSLS